MRKFLHNCELLDPEAAASRRGAVVVTDGRIEAVLAEEERGPADAEPVDLAGQALAPGFIDVHFHGELIFADDADLPAAFERTARRMIERGTTAYLATTVTWHDARIQSFLTQAEAEMTRLRQDGAQAIGIHLEGPWINPDAVGAQPASWVRPYDAAEAREILARGQDLVKMVTLAPEMPGGGQLVDALARAGIVASLGHSRARHDAIGEFVTRGMTHATHLFNAMGPFLAREPGVPGSVLADDRMTADLICDGVHLHPTTVRIAARAKGERVLLVTDRIELPQARAEDFGSGAIHDDGTAMRMADGTLAGSTLTLDRALQNAQAFGAMTRIEAVAAVTLRPARLLGIEAERGTLRPGARADFAILDTQDRVRETWLGGDPVYSN